MGLKEVLLQQQCFCLFEQNPPLISLPCVPTDTDSGREGLHSRVGEQSDGGGVGGGGGGGGGGSRAARLTPADRCVLCGSVLLVSSVLLNVKYTQKTP